MNKQDNKGVIQIIPKTYRTIDTCYVDMSSRPLWGDVMLKAICTAFLTLRYFQISRPEGRASVLLAPSGLHQGIAGGQGDAKEEHSEPEMTATAKLATTSSGGPLSSSEEEGEEEDAVLLDVEAEVYTLVRVLSQLFMLPNKQNSKLLVKFSQLSRYPSIRLLLFVRHSFLFLIFRLVSLS